MSDPPEGDVWSRLSVLTTFVESAPRTAGGGELLSRLDSLRQLREEGAQRERRIAFFGVAKTGKSSLINALLGAPLLPARATRATSVVTRVRWGPRFVARCLVDGEDVELSAANVAAAVLHGTAREGSIVEIEIPLPFLPERCVLADTPALMEAPGATQQAMDEVAHSDLAVMVLAADKPLSAREREAARLAHDLLRGNVVCVVNRFDAIDEEDREEVLQWVRRGLGGSGNRLVGGEIGATSAVTRDDEGVVRLRHRVITLFESPAGDAVAMIARLGALERELGSALLDVRADLAGAHSETAARRAEAEREASLLRSDILRRLGHGSAALDSCSRRLSGHADTFVAACVERTREKLREPEGRISVVFDSAAERFEQEVSEDVADAMAGLPVSVPPFTLKNWIMRGEVDAAVDRLRALGASAGEFLTQIVDGGRLGRETGASLGGWLGKHVLNVDAERETLHRVEQVARGMGPALQSEAEGYITRCKGLLTDAETFYEDWSPPAPRLAEAQRREAECEECVRWWQRFLMAVERLAEEIEGETDDA